MQEIITNFQKKHGKKVPLPKLYMDEDSSDSEGLVLADRTRVGRKATDGAGGSSGGKPGRKPTAGGSSSGAGGLGGGGSANTSGSGGASTSGGGGIGGSRGDNPGWGRKRGRDDDDPDDDPIKRKKTSHLPSHQDSQWQGRSHRRANQCMVVNTSAQEYDRVLFILQLIETWLPSTCHIPKRGPSWVSIH